MDHFYIFLLPLVITTILVPFVATLSVKIGGIDAPDERKIHCIPTPRLGGIAIFCSLLFAIIFFCDLDQKIRGFLAGAICIFLTGLIDDLKGITPRQKFAGEFIAAGLVVLVGGISVRNLGTPFGVDLIELGPFAITFTIIGIVGVINAINLLDGLDGLAGGVCTVASLAFATLAYTSHNATLLPIAIALIGALLGFLRYNNYPAIIFMGDCGSLLVGYCMGVFSVLLATEGQAPVSPYIPLLVLGAPILDTLVVMTNRKRTGKRLFLPDKTHLHHRILALGLSHKYTVLIVFGISYLLSMLAVLGRHLDDTSLLLLLAGVAGAVYGVMKYVKTFRWRGRFHPSSNQSFRSTRTYRQIVSQSAYLLNVIKLVLIVILLLPLFLSAGDLLLYPFMPIAFLMFSIFVYLVRPPWGDMLIQSFIYFSSAFFIFMLENNGGEAVFLGCSLNQVARVILLLLFILVSVKIFFRNRASKLMVSPFEYLIMLVALSVPLLPKDISVHYHMPIVAAESILLFVGFKLVLMRQMKQNRKIILAMAFSSLVLTVRYFAFK